MDPQACALRFNQLFDQTYHRFHGVTDPRTPRVSPEAIAVLHHLAGTGPLTITEACRHFDRSQAAVSEQFARLEARGLITRFADERDRRRTLVWLSEAGKQELDRARQVLSVERLAAAMTTMPVDARRALVDALTRLVDAPIEPNPHRTDAADDGGER